MQPRQKAERQEVYTAVLLHIPAHKNTKTKEKEMTYFTEKKKKE